MGNVKPTVDCNQRVVVKATGALRALGCVSQVHAGQMKNAKRRTTATYLARAYRRPVAETRIAQKTLPAGSSRLFVLHCFKYVCSMRGGGLAFRAALKTMTARRSCARPAPAAFIHVRQVPIVTVVSARR